MQITISQGIHLKEGHTQNEGLWSSSLKKDVGTPAYDYIKVTSVGTSRNIRAGPMWLLLRLPSGMITITNYYLHKRACQGHPFLLFIVGEMYLKFHRSWSKQGSLNSSSCPSKHFVKVYTVLAQVTQCEFTQRLLHSASGNINHFKEDINDTILIEVITIVLMWTC